MSRIENTGKNFLFSFLASILTAITSFISRTVFVRTIGLNYLGANGLFTNILAMLSLTELGLSSAIGYSLYAPLAKNDVDTIKSLMRFYKNAYRIIALVIAALGIGLIPFLKFLIKDPGDIQHIPLIYVVFLYNTVISYVFSYKITLLVADQKSYVMTNMTMAINVVTVIIQTGVLLISKNYFLYLFIGAGLNTAQWAFINKRIYKLYPYLKEKDIAPLAKGEKQTIATNVKAMTFHKVGELCINQTDNLIISSIISIAAVGIYSNYHMIISIINRIAKSIFNSATASLGNLIATESYERQYEVFKRYNFLGFWVFGWTGVCLYTLLSPFIKLWLGDSFLMDDLTLTLVMIDYYLVGMRITIGNVKMAAGLYAQDQWAPIVQAFINLFVSIFAAVRIGLPGVFLGTVVSSICVPCWYRPVVVFKYAFHRPIREYFSSYFLYLGITMFNVLLIRCICRFVIDAAQLSAYLTFFLKACACAILPNVVILLIFHRTEEFLYLQETIKSILKRIFR